MDRNLPAEIILIIGNYVQFKEYIQLSQTCKSIQRILTSTSAVNYLNNRFKFGQDTGALLLFTYYNILYVPKILRRVVLEQFLHTVKDEVTFVIKGWSIIHAIRCSDPGKFMTALLIDEENKKNKPKKSIIESEIKEELILKLQQLFAIEIFDGIIQSQIFYKTKVCQTKTYQSVFKKLVLLGDLRTVEYCLRSLGSPIDSIIIFDLDYYNRFPLNHNRNNRYTFSTNTINQHHFHSLNYYSNNDINTVESICKNSQYLNYNSDEMCCLTEILLKKYNIKVERESKIRRSNIIHCN